MTIVTGIFLLGFLVFIHELGHFFAARICGVKVEAFSIGMGPVLIHKTFFNTDWRISLLPFGGYCSMKGEHELEESYEYSYDFAEKDSFYGISAIKRAFIGFCGPASNLIFSIFAYFLVALIGFNYYSAGNTISIATDYYPELHSAAADAGIISGDKIVKINHKDVNDFSEIYTEVATHPDEDLLITVERNGDSIEFIVHTDLNKKTGEGKIGIVSNPDSIVRRESKRYSLPGAIKQGIFETLNIIYLSFKGVINLFNGVSFTESVSGPGKITSILGETAKTGFMENFRTGLCSILQLMGVISVSLFIMNLLPIPILDGFLVYSNIIEFIFRIHISRKFRNVIQYVGIVVIAFLFLLAINGDFHYFLELINVKKN